MDADVKDHSPDPSGDRNASDQELDDIADPAEQARPTGNATNGQRSGQRSSAKDPSRPRRKKARRACFACQRAHLTCGTLELL